MDPIKLAALVSELLELLSDGFQAEDLEKAAKAVVKAAYEAIPGEGSGPARKAWCVEQLLRVVEDHDHLIPVLGAWLDNPLADAIERWGVEKAVEKALGAVLEWAYVTQ